MVQKVLLTLCVTASLLQAQTLNESVARVLETNPIVLERLSNYRETSQDLSIARSEYLPTLDLISSIGIEKTDISNSDILANDTSLNYYENSLTLMYNVFNGFGTVNKVDYQKSRIIAAAYNFVEKANDVAFQMTKAYIEVLKQRELLDTAQENVRINEDIFNKIKDLYRSGIATKSEMRKIESSLFLARSNLVVQENNTIDTLFNFKKVYGERINVDTLEIPSFEVFLPKTLNEAMEYAIRHNPSILVSNYNIKAAQHLKQQKKLNYYPKIDLMVQQNLDKNTFGIEDDRNRFRAGAVLTYNLYRGGSDSENIQKSISAIYKEVQIKNELQRQTIEGLELSWSANMMIKRQLKELYKYRSFSEETLSLYQEEYDIGRRTLLDLLSAQNDLINAKSQIINANYDNLFAKYRILDAMGLLVAGIMGNEYSYMENVGLAGFDVVDNEDTLPVSYDLDGDNIAANEDLCQASSTDGNILSNGCMTDSKKFKEIKHFDLVYMDNDVYEADSEEIFNQFSAIINEIKSTKDSVMQVVIQTHTSESGDESVDYNNSIENANKIEKVFVENGVNGKKIKLVANGSSSPISSDTSLNNRVNVILYTK